MKVSGPDVWHSVEQRMNSVTGCRPFSASQWHRREKRYLRHYERLLLLDGDFLCGEVRNQR